MIHIFSPYRPNNLLQRCIGASLILVLLGLLTVSRASARLAAKVESPLFRMLNTIPAAITLDPQYTLSYVDYPALFAARPGAVWPASVEAWEAFDKEQQRLFMATFVGVNGGMSDLPQVLRQVREMREVTGLDLFTVAQTLEYGQPPAQGRVLFGQFDLQAIETALKGRKYNATPADGLSLWCPEEGCDKGFKQNLQGRNPANPFGGKLGRDELFAFDSTRLLNSPALPTMNALLATAEGSGKSLGELPEVRAAAEAISAQGTVIQVWLVNGGVTRPYPVLRDPRLSPEQQKELMDRLKAQFEGAGNLPPYSLVAFAHVSAADHIRTVVALVYDQPDAAEQAGKALLTRIESYQSLAVRRPFAELLAERGATVEKPVVFVSDDTKRYVTVLTFTTPIEVSEAAADQQLPPSGVVFRLMIRMLFQRDTGWLASEIVAPK